MSDKKYFPMVPPIEDTTSYRLITNDYVKTIEVSGREILEVDPEGIAILTAKAFSDTSHLLRTQHLEQLRKILDDQEASDNDRFVALDLLKNANIASGRILPMCQDTGTAIIIGKKGEQVDAEREVKGREGGRKEGRKGGKKRKIQGKSEEGDKRRDEREERRQGEGRVFQERGEAGCLPPIYIAVAGVECGVECKPI